MHSPAGCFPVREWNRILEPRANTAWVQRSGEGVVSVYLRIVMLLLLTGSVLAGEIRQGFRLEPGEFGVNDFDGGVIPWCSSGVVGFEEGLPNLPVVSVCFVIPQGTSVAGATIEVLAGTDLDGTHDVLPVRFTPLSSAPAPYFRQPFVYLSDEPFPADPVVETATGTRTGFQLGTVSFCPFRWRPLSGGLTIITEAEVVLRYREDPMFPGLQLTRGQIDQASALLSHFVANPEDLAAHAPALRPESDAWPVWVAVGAESFASVLQPLVDHRNSTGMQSEFVSLEWIQDNYSGWDTQEQIRNYLKDSFLNRGLQYALLVGDWGPTQRISSLMVGSDSLVLNETADLYFSDLTRMWDGDGDHLYGENTDWVDYYADITVGRFSSDNPNHLQTMVNKTIAYETQSDQGQWRTTALLCGAGLWPDVEPDGYWGSFICDSISTRIPGDWTQHKLYETWDGHPTNQIDLLNQGASYVSDQGHGGSGGVYWLYEPGNMITNQNYTGLENINRLTILHSMACNPGQLSVNGCSAERLLMWPNGGAVAVMYNSNYGFGTPPSMGPSEHLELHFAEMLFVNGVERIGDMQAAAKDAFKAAGGMTLQNWVMQENNMLGDPATVFVSVQTGIGEAGGMAVAQLGTPVPNPSAGTFSVTWSLPEPSAFTLGLYDLCGRLTWSAEHAGSVEASGQFTVSPSKGLPPGCYILRLDAGRVSASTMVVVLGD